MTSSAAASLSGPGPQTERVLAIVQRRLAVLPARQKQICDFFRSRGITGCRNSSHRCVLGRYLGVDLPPGYLVRVDDDEVSLLEGGRAGRVLHRIPLLDQLTLFVTRFDTGQVPDLIDPDQ